MNSLNKKYDILFNWRFDMMKYKLIAIDMDGTLLNSENKVSNRTKDAIVKAKDRGVHVVLATGRILKSAKSYSKKLNLANPIVASNGGIMIDEYSNVIYKNPLDKKSIKEIVKLAGQSNVYCHLYDETKFYSSEKVEDVLAFYSEGDENMSIELELFKNIDDLLNVEDLNIYKLIFIDNDIEKLQDFRKKISTVENINISSSWANNVEAMGLNVSKGEAIKKLAESLDLELCEVMAIGDSENDLSMLDIAGLSVAMGNGADSIKDKVDFVTDTNDNDGVAKAIEKFILECENNEYES